MSLVDRARIDELKFLQRGFRTAIRKNFLVKPWNRLHWEDGGPLSLVVFSRTCQTSVCQECHRYSLCFLEGVEGVDDLSKPLPVSFFCDLPRYPERFIYLYQCIPVFLIQCLSRTER